MKPFLIEWVFKGHLVRVPSFGVFLASAFSFAYFWSLRNARKLSLESKHVEKLFLLILLSSIAGGRLFHVLFEEPRFYWSHLSKIPAVWEGGFTFYGAMLCSLGAILLYCRIYGLSSGKVLDLVATSTLMSLSIGRIGCFLAGCCWGKTCSLPWAVTYTHPEAFNSLKGLSVHPTQLYESLGAFLLFFLCQRNLFSRHIPGETGLIALFGYALLRFLVEWFRGDTYRGFIGDGFLSYAQVISIVIGTLALVGWTRLKQHHKLF